MTTIVTRAGKGSPLTHTEVDTNFTNLNTAKLETAAIPLGTLQAPSVSFLNDSDTGIFCPQGGNSLAIATGGQYAISCTSTQAVGIKTANPQKTLHVAGSTRVGADDATDAFLEIGEGATGNRNSYIDIVGDTTYTDYGVRLIRNNTGANATSEIKHRGTGNFNITTQEASAIQFSTSNTPQVTITSGGLVGLGTSSPSSLLHLSASTPIFRIDASNNAASSTIQFLGKDSNGNQNSKAQIIHSVTETGSGIGATLNFLTTKESGGGATFTSSLFIDKLGLVGIGTTGPSQLLTTVGNIKIAGAQASNVAKLCLTRTDRSWSINNETDLRFYYGAGDTDSPSTMPVVFTAGSVGIGIAAPTATLHVKADDPALFIQDANGTGSGINATIQFRDSSDTQQAYFGYASSADSHFSLFNKLTGGNIVFGTNNTASATIDSSGRLLVGTTSAAGLVSNIAPVVAGAFKSNSGTVTIAPSTTTTIFTIPASNGEGAYTVTAIYTNSNNVAVFSAYAVILYDGSAANAYRAMGFDGSLLSITVSGRDVQLTTGAGYTQGISWSFIRQAVA